MAEQSLATPPKPPASATMAEHNSNPLGQENNQNAPQLDPKLSSAPPPPAPMNVNPAAVAPPMMQPYASFRPVMQYSTLAPNPSLPPAMSYQAPVAPVGVPPPGVMMPTTGQVQAAAPPYGQPMRPLYAPMPNGYPGMPQGSVAPPVFLNDYTVGKASIPVL